MSTWQSDYRALEEMQREEKRERAKKNGELYGRENWTIHTEYHWGRWVDGKKLDFWPTTNKWMYNGRVKHNSTPEDFLTMHGEKL